MNHSKTVNFTEEVSESIRCRGQGVGSSGDVGMASVRRGSVPIPAGSTLNPPQYIAEPISKSDGTSGKVFLRKGKRFHRQRRREKGKNGREKKKKKK